MLLQMSHLFSLSLSRLLSDMKNRVRVSFPTSAFETRIFVETVQLDGSVNVIIYDIYGASDVCNTNLIKQLNAQ